MKSFKEFKTESYSRLDEGKVGLGQIINKGLTWWSAGQGYDLAKPQNKEGNPYVRKGVQAAVTFPKTAWKRAAKPALTGTYNLAKWGVTKGIPGAVTTTGKIIGALYGMNKLK